MLWHALWNERVNNNKQKTKAIFRCTMDGIKNFFRRPIFILSSIFAVINHLMP